MELCMLFDWAIAISASILTAVVAGLLIMILVSIANDLIEDKFKW